jgi:hypothetical protein
VRQYNTPTNPKNLATVTGFFLQDSWSMNRLTLNLGARWDKYVGKLPEQGAPAGRFVGVRSIPETPIIDHSRGVWRLGASYDLTGTGRTAVKASYSRYALQVGIDRVTNLNPLGDGSRTCPWTDPNGDGRFTENEVNVAQCSAFSGGVNTRYADGIRWPYSDEVTAGIETQLPGAVRMGAMFYYRTNRDQFGQRNEAVPTSTYTAHTIAIPSNGTGVTSATIYNLRSDLVSAQDLVRFNADYLDTEYKGIEFTATKRFTQKWQMQAGFTIGKNTGGVTGSGNDLNDPNNTLFPQGVIGNDSETALRLSGSYELPWQINFAGSVIANNGYPYETTYQLTRANAATQGITLTRANQTIQLAERGDERYPNVVMADIRLSRRFRFAGNRSFQPEISIFNITNADTVVAHTVAIGGNYLRPTQILAPRIARIGFSLNF